MFNSNSGRVGKGEGVTCVSEYHLYNILYLNYIRWFIDG